MAWTEAQKRYARSEKGKAARKRYQESEKGKAARARYIAKRAKLNADEKAITENTSKNEELA